MALIKCRECGKEISDKATTCPNCGIKIHPIKNIIKIVVILFIVIIVLCLGIFIFSGGLTNIKNYSMSKKIEGLWVLQNNIEGVKQNIKIDNVMICAGDGNCLHKNNQYMVGKNDIFDNYTGSEYYVCLELKDKNTLIQTNCKDDGVSNYSSYNYIKEMGIIYKKK
ncbi:MAG: zinc ribbon domain-containing protein [Candidatus Coprovivens sp.]